MAFLENLNCNIYSFENFIQIKGSAKLIKVEKVLSCTTTKWEIFYPTSLLQILFLILYTRTAYTKLLLSLHRQNFGPFWENQMLKNWSYKNVNNKNCFTKFIFWNKKMKKIQMLFDLEIQMLALSDHFWESSLVQISRKSLEFYVWRLKYFPLKFVIDHVCSWNTPN